MNLDNMPQKEGESFLVYAQNYEKDGMVWHQVSWFEGNLYPDAMSYNINYTDKIDLDTVTAWVALPKIELEKE